MRFPNQSFETGQRLRVRLELLAERRLELFRQPPAFLARDVGAEKTPEGRVVAMAENLRRQLFRVVRDAVFVEQVNPLPQVERVRVNQHAVHVENQGGGHGDCRFAIED